MTRKKDSAEKAIRDIRRATRRRYSAEEKIRIVLEGLRGGSSIAELCRKEGATNFSMACALDELLSSLPVLSMCCGNASVELVYSDFIRISSLLYSRGEIG